MEEDQSQSQSEQKVEPSAAEKLLIEEKAKLEEQLKDVTVSVSGLLGCTRYKLRAQEPPQWVLSAQSGYDYVSTV